MLLPPPLTPPNRLLLPATPTPLLPPPLPPGCTPAAEGAAPAPAAEFEETGPEVEETEVRERGVGLAVYWSVQRSRRISEIGEGVDWVWGCVLPPLLPVPGGCAILAEVGCMKICRVCGDGKGGGVMTHHS